MAVAVECVYCGHLFRVEDSSRGRTGQCPKCQQDVVARGETVRDYDVFVSHSHHDEQVALDMCAALERTRLRCWIAPRDIEAGVVWGEAIINGIEASCVMIVVFSEQSNASNQVYREVERAAAKGLPIIPFRVDGVAMTKRMEYFLSACQWLDVQTGSMAGHIGTLVRRTRTLLEEEDQPPLANFAAPGLPGDIVAVARVATGPPAPAAGTPAVASTPVPPPRTTPTVTSTPTPARESTSATGKAPPLSSETAGGTGTPEPALPRRRWKWRLAVTLCLTAIVIAVWGAVWFQSGSEPSRQARTRGWTGTGRGLGTRLTPTNVRFRISGDRAVLALPGSRAMEFVKIQPGVYLMGSLGFEAGHMENEVRHQVTLTNAFWVGKYEVTQAQYRNVMGMNPSGNTGDDLPVESVTWLDCEKFFEKLNVLAQGQFQLPTEAQWEYACRAGTTTTYHFGDNPALLSDYAWHSDNSGGRSQPIGLKKPNAWGLHDMHGNVWEWCQDELALYPEGPVRDPIGSGTTPARVVRGGSFITDDVTSFRCAARSNDYDRKRSTTRGFRCARNSTALDQFFVVPEEEELGPPEGLAELRRDWERAIADRLSP